MKVTMNVLDLQPMKELSEIFADVIKDERIPVKIRMEYIGRFDAIEWEGEVNG